MNHQQLAKEFADSFSASGGVAVSAYSNGIRFLALMSVIIAICWSINYFMNAEEREHEGFLLRLGSRAVRLSLGFIFFILFLT